MLGRRESSSSHGFSKIRPPAGFRHAAIIPAFETAYLDYISTGAVFSKLSGKEASIPARNSSIHSVNWLEVPFTVLQSAFA
jgi:hypothetical protein